MSYGLRVWNANGVLTLDITDRITRYISTHPFSMRIPVDQWNDNYSLNVPVSGIATDGSWFVVGDYEYQSGTEQFSYTIFSGYVRVSIYSIRYDGGYTYGSFTVYRC